MSNENNTGKEGSDKKRRKGSIFGGTPIDGCADEKYVLPKVWKWDHPDPESNNKPTAGHRFKGDLPVGKHPLQLYSMATQNGQKVTIMLEELLESGFKGAEYDAWLINIMNKEQFSSGFVDINPNSKIPALVDRSTATKEGDGNDSTNSGGYGHIKVFESGSILLYLAEKFDNAFLPTDPMKRVKTMNWFFWNVGSSPLVGNFGHFFHFATVKQRYPVDRFTMETKRLLDVLNRHLKDNEYLAGDEYTIADIANWPWYAGLLDNDGFFTNCAEFLNVEEDYPHVIRWAKKIGERPAVKRGKIVNKFWGGEPSEQLAERHDSSDFDGLPTTDNLERPSH